MYPLDAPFHLHPLYPTCPSLPPTNHHTLPVLKSTIRDSDLTWTGYCDFFFILQVVFNIQKCLSMTKLLCGILDSFGLRKILSEFDGSLYLTLKGRKI